MTDIVLTENDEGGGVIAHAPDCPVVQKHREQERLILTMYDVQKPMAQDMPVHDCLIPDDTPVHSCLKRDD